MLAALGAVSTSLANGLYIGGGALTVIIVVVVVVVVLRR